MILIRLAYASSIGDPSKLLKKLKENIYNQNDKKNIYSLSADNNLDKNLSNKTQSDVIQENEHQNRIPSNFFELVELFKQNGEMLLYSQIKSSDHLVSFKAGEITIRKSGHPAKTLSREISEKTGAKIEINDEGLVSIAAVDGESGQAAIDWVNSIVEEPEVGKIYEGKVVKLMDFGAFVNFMGSRDGLVHISQLKNERVEKVSDVVNEGDTVKVKVLDIDSRGKVKLSMKDADKE